METDVSPATLPDSLIPLISYCASYTSTYSVSITEFYYLIFRVGLFICLVVLLKKRFKDDWRFNNGEINLLVDVLIFKQFEMLFNMYVIQKLVNKHLFCKYL